MKRSDAMQWSVAAGAVLAAVATHTVMSQTASIPSTAAASDPRFARFTHSGRLGDEGAAGRFDAQGQTAATTFVAPSAPEALTGFDNLTNGFDVQGAPFGTLNEDNAVAGRSFNDNRFIFEEVETVADGLGPTYNGQSCRECHQNVATGGASQVTVQRTGRTVGGQFFESLGGSLLHSRATSADIVEHVTPADTTRTFRISTNTRGDGYVEAIANATLLAIRDAQPFGMRGIEVMVPVLEGDGSARLGRFGWKAQHASLHSFAADAYLNEMGITSPLFPAENTSSGRYVGFGSGYDTVQDPEDDGDDVKAFANFIRATKAPPRGPITAEASAGERVFDQIGCSVCHVSSITTAPAGTRINANAMTVPAALGNKVIHPYSDFLLHDIGTGDGIPVLPQAAYANTANRMKTAPLWGLRTRNRLMHDGLSFTYQEAIARHGGQAAVVTSRYNALSPTMKAQLIAFLGTL